MPFTPITLVMTDVTIDVDDTAFTIDGYDFSAYRAKTYSLESPNVSAADDGVMLAYAIDNNQSNIELELSNTAGISKIKIELSDFCGDGCTFIQTLNDNSVLQEIEGSTIDTSQRSVVTFKNVSSAITALKLSSFETRIHSITLE